VAEDPAVSVTVGPGSHSVTAFAPRSGCPKERIYSTCRIDADASQVLSPEAVRRLLQAQFCGVLAAFCALNMPLQHILKAKA
jgi:hypothetical protein